MKGLLTEEYGQLVKGLRRRPLTAKTRVRFPYWLLSFSGWFPRFTISLYIQICLCCFYTDRDKIWPVGQGVKTSPSHGENTGSIPVLAVANN